MKHFPSYTIALTGLILFALYAVPVVGKHEMLTFSIVEYGAFDVDQFAPATDLFQAANGHWYINSQPGTSFLGALLYLPFRVVVNRLFTTYALSAELKPIVVRWLTYGLGLGALVGIGCALTGAIVYRFTNSISIATATGLLSLFGTFYFPLATDVVGNQTTLMLSIVVMLWLLSSRKGLSPLYVVLAGLAYGWGVLSDIIGILIYPFVLGFLWMSSATKQIDRLLQFLIGGIPPFLLLLFYNYQCFGNPLTIGYLQQADTGPGKQWWFVIPRLDWLWDNTFGVNLGLFTTSPLLLLGIYGMVVAIVQRQKATSRENQFLILAASIIVVYLLMTISYTASPTQGYNYGPRFLLPTIPSFMVFVGIAFTKLSLRKIVLPVSIFSVLLQLLAVNSEIRASGTSGGVLFLWSMALIKGINIPLYTWLRSNLSAYTPFTPSHISPSLLIVVIVVILIAIWCIQLLPDRQHKSEIDLN
ncbi:MAG: hypothetical protein NZ772_11450 [Cyanobacteria bacterium]|nr:hypothetical protein [Cyanobacteriota bacterium]MDW8202052.1 hypothetical protein [Cyanobacteriota bacterium SKYGB_h_bin112]